MEPVHILFVVAVIFAGWFLWKRKSRLKAATVSPLLHVLDALLFSYLAYLAVAVIADFNAFRSCGGLLRILFFAGRASGGQVFAIAFGSISGLLRFFEDEITNALTENKSEYRGGRRLRCHYSAIVIADANLERLAKKKGLKKPRHMSESFTYEKPSEEWLDEMRAVPEVETNGALSTYVSNKGELDTVQWGLIRIPYESTTTHFCVIGSSGSGKTLAIQALMTSVLPRIKTDKNFRVFIYDDKPDFLPFAKSLGIDKYIWTLDPFDADGYAWDIAADVSSVAEAIQVASCLCPAQSGADQYWEAAPQNLLAAVLISFHEINKKEWTLRDVMLSFNSEERLTQVINRSELAKSYVQLILQAKSLPDVLSVLTTKIIAYKVAAALYEKAGKKKKSVRKWSNSNAILRVTGISTFADSTKPINQAIFRMVSLLLLSKDEQIATIAKTNPGAEKILKKEKKSGKTSTPESTWIFLDEIREIGKLPGFRELGNKGRSKGVRLVIGFQLLEGMHAEHGLAAGNEIANMCAHRMYLFSSSANTREWMAKQVGNCVVDETVFTFSKSVTTSKSDTSHTAGVSHTTNRVTRAAVEAADFDENIRMACDDYGVTALNIVPSVGTYVSWAPWTWVKEQLPARQQHKTEFRKKKDQKIKPWASPDLFRLKLDPSVLEDADETKEEETEKTDDEQNEASDKSSSGGKPLKPPKHLPKSKREELGL